MPISKARFTSNGVTFGRFLADDLAAYEGWGWGDDTIGYSVGAWSDGRAVVWIQGGSTLDGEWGLAQSSYVANDYIYSGLTYQKRWYGYVGGETYGYTYSVVSPACSEDSGDWGVQRVCIAATYDIGVRYGGTEGTSNP